MSFSSSIVIGNEEVWGLKVTKYFIYGFPLIDYYVSLKDLSHIWRCQHCRWRVAKFRPMLDAQGLWAGTDLYRATPVVTRDLGFSGLILRTTPFSRLLQHTKGCGGSILTRIFTGLYGFWQWSSMRELTTTPRTGKRTFNEFKQTIP
jgi:hypothetical protein